MTTNTNRDQASKTPYTAKTDAEISAMPSSVVESGDFWILTDGYHVTLSEQKTGDSPKQYITVPRDIFDKFVRWYITGKMNGRIE